MISFLKTYKAFFISPLIVVPAFFILNAIGFIKIPKDLPGEVFVITLFWCLIMGLPIHFYGYLKQKKKTVFRILSLFILIVIALFIDSFMNMPDNPITFILIMAFWLGIAYVLATNFINKYIKFIALLYLPLVLYFMYLRLFSGDLEAYLKIKEDFPFFIFFIPIPLFFLLWIFEQWKWLQNLKQEKSKTELALLKAQINPHFFFNTLNNLYALTIKNSKQAPEVILKLSDMMRYTIYEGEKETVTLHDEIEYLNNYIELHKIRYKKTVDISFNHAIDVTLTIAPLLYIILLENAFKHGVETLTENAYIHINLFDDDDSIYFKIENNFDSSELSTTPGIGLQNLKRRLDLSYNQKHDLQIHKTNNSYTTTLKISKHA